MGISRPDEAKARQKLQRQKIAEQTKELKKTAKRVGAAEIYKEIMIDAKRRNGDKKVEHERTEYSTPALEQAKIASGAAVEPIELTAEQKAEMRRLEQEELEKQKVRSFEEPEIKYQKAKKILMALNNLNNYDPTDEEVLFAARYRKSKQFAVREMLDDDPIDWASLG